MVFCMAWCMYRSQRRTLYLEDFTVVDGEVIFIRCEMVFVDFRFGAD